MSAAKRNSSPKRNAALTVLNQFLDVVGVADTSGVATAEENAKNLAALELGAETVDLTGVDRYVMPRGAGNGTMYAPRLAGQAVASRGPAILLKIPGTGAVDAKGSEITIGRTAKGENDYLATYSKAISSPITWNNNQTDYLKLPELTINVKCAAGVTTLIRAECVLGVEPSNSATAIQSSLSIGAGTNGEKWLNDTDATENGVWTSKWPEPVSHKHERLILGTTATEANGIPVVPRIRRIGQAAGSYNPRTTFDAGAPIQTISASNLRSYAGIADDNIVTVVPSGAGGVIAAGPYKNTTDNYTWYSVSFTGIGVGYMATSQIRVNDVAPQVPQTNSLINAWIRVERIPV